MRKVFQLVRDYARSVSPWAFALVATLLGIAIWINYSFHFERKWIDVPQGSFAAAAKFAVFYSVPFLSAFALQTFFSRRRQRKQMKAAGESSELPESAFVKDPRFWLLLALAPIIFCLRDVSWIYVLGFRSATPFEANIGDTIIRWVICVTPIVLYWRTVREPGERLYGLTLGDLHVKPYFAMLAIMVPLVCIASFRPDFLHAYPRAELVSMKGHPAFSNLQYTVYEIVYGLDFVFTEFFFRGFVVMSLAKFVGRAAILPMAAFYVFIHFGKPMGEAISSFFGGLILGVVALETRSIFGGVIVHLGIAWLMEITAFVQKIIR